MAAARRVRFNRRRWLELPDLAAMKAVVVRVAVMVMAWSFQGFGVRGCTMGESG